MKSAVGAAQENMAEYRKLTPEEQASAAREVKKYSSRGFLDPSPVFEPEGFDLRFCYFRDGHKHPPIPEFRVYASQFLTLLAIVLCANRELLADSAISLEATIESDPDSLNLVFLVKPRIATHASSSQVSALHRIGSSFAAALRTLFPRVEDIFWDSEVATGFAKLWTKYPGQMTPDGFLRTSGEPFFGWTARADLECPNENQRTRALAVLKFLDEESAARDA